ncbi:dTDP-glucose 4,6-dehydratase [Methanothermobacter thermautotrophicus str. Delta H]|uniref:dTDP-glucose 4,6-dehydratase n=1 Tax=Methanothermobacter thermautotrophicus (strain ATCC 29096 / DSM 1053 / JCM 10044 / NBRC 100330 / Delta H) TaxID=187420 RepID=O27817_METTH|nr:dTDP-glucose 4,6-dehydratase [Methanothermobacter thermautotrophicus]AAB86255.1 dTDP-glucose 4,6-dehydratase [Methanothermobacter thermautotrophicus str. Delta H]NLU04543.1 dTDP-glucose 4,6-dehydratase [Methanothermobacter sp.]WBF06255.1 dTDP-glucose 4,6-dehydratase [Methanothermobacter thermautotrophicus]HOQ18312.1 dTDP-glucose 4,6-dehydratase [Methanothermobacter thermautotrophicus]
MEKILVTGGAGFIGSNFIRYMLQEHPYHIINLDALTYCGNLENLRGVEDEPRYTFVRGSITDRKLVDGIIKDVDAVINFAAESHVDRSIEDPEIFIRTNILGTQTLLEASRKHGVERFIQISTDEVYGSAEKGYFTEETPLAPNSPYSASKASADLMVRAYHRTYGLPVNITRCSNNYGPYQFPEKLIPLMITNALENKPLPVYGDGMNVRDWIHVLDHCRAVDLVLHRGRVGEVYNIGGNSERRNIEIVELIVRELGKDESLIRFVEDRPGHDRRYAIDASKIRNELGWKPLYSFEEGIRETIRWYIDNRDWWENIKSGEYLRYYERMYGGRLQD